MMLCLTCGRHVVFDSRPLRTGEGRWRHDRATASRDGWVHAAGDLDADHPARPWADQPELLPAGAGR